MKRRQRLIRRSIFPLAIALVSGLVIGVGVAGLPDPETLNPVAGRPPLTVKPGILTDPAELTVPPLLLSPETLPTSSSSPSTTTTTLPSDVLRSRADVQIMVANGNRTNGAAAQWGDRLVSLGYPQPSLANTAETTEWIIYYADGYQGEAQRLATDLTVEFLEVGPATAPLSQAPSTQPAFEGQILLVLGMRDLGGASSTSASTTTTTP